MERNNIYNEKELLQQVATGDTIAFTKLVRAYKDNIYTASLRLLKDVQRAEDGVQDTFLKVWLHRETLPSLDNFGGWLNTVARNTLLSSLKRLAREKVGLEHFPQNLPPEERTVEDLLSQKEQALLLHAAIASLPERQQQVYRLIKEEGLKREEVAARLGISADTVKFHLAAAKRHIRTYALTHGDITIIIMLALYNY